MLRLLSRAAGIAALSLFVAGCFDLDQKVAIGRDGSGAFAMVIAAEGFMGDALKDGKSDMLKPNRAKTTAVTKNGKTTLTSRVDFKTLSELKLSDEIISLKVMSRDFLGFGQSHVRLTHVFHVDKAREARKQPSDNGMGRDVLASIFGGHSYAFTVTVPGSVERAPAIRIGGQEFKPQISGGYLSHTVVWRLPLAAALSARDIKFEVDFAAMGDFKNVSTRPV